MANLSITEFQGDDGFTDQLKISGSSDETDIRQYVQDWCETNNSLFDEIDHVGSYFIAQVRPDDYR